MYHEYGMLLSFATLVIPPWFQILFGHQFLPNMYFVYDHSYHQQYVPRYLFFTFDALWF